MLSTETLIIIGIVTVVVVGLIYYVYTRLHMYDKSITYLNQRCDAIEKIVTVSDNILIKDVQSVVEKQTCDDGMCFFEKSEPTPSEMEPDSVTTDHETIVQAEIERYVVPPRKQKPQLPSPPPSNVEK